MSELETGCHVLRTDTIHVAKRISAAVARLGAKKSGLARQLTSGQERHLATSPQPHSQTDQRLSPEADAIQAASKLARGRSQNHHR